MGDSEVWIVKCVDTTDESGGFIVDLPPELLARVSWGIGDVLSVEVIEGSIILKPLLSSHSLHDDHPLA